MTRLTLIRALLGELTTRCVTFGATASKLFITITQLHNINKHTMTRRRTAVIIKGAKSGAGTIPNERLLILQLSR